MGIPKVYILRLFKWIMEMEIKERIVFYLKNRNQEPSTINDISKELNVGYQTIRYYLGILVAEKVVRMSDYGNVKLYYFNEKQNE